MNPVRSSVPGKGSVGPKLKNSPEEADAPAMRGPGGAAWQRETTPAPTPIASPPRGKKVSLDPRAYGLQPSEAPVPSPPLGPPRAPEPAASLPHAPRLRAAEPRPGEAASRTTVEPDPLATARTPLRAAGESSSRSPAAGRVTEGLEREPASLRAPTEAGRAAVTTAVSVGARPATPAHRAVTAPPTPDALLDQEGAVPTRSWRRLQEAVITVALLALACSGGLWLAMCWD